MPSSIPLAQPHRFLVPAALQESDSNQFKDQAQVLPLRSVVREAGRMEPLHWVRPALQAFCSPQDVCWAPCDGRSCASPAAIFWSAEPEQRSDDGASSFRISGS